MHSALCIDIHESKLTVLSHSELNILRSKYRSLKATIYEEVSMIGKRLFNKSNQRLQQILGNIFGGLHVITLGNLYQIAPVKDLYIFKDDDTGHGPHTMNLLTESCNFRKSM